VCVCVRAPSTSIYGAHATRLISVVGGMDVIHMHLELRHVHAHVTASMDC
jgi:hypothetical protein